MIEEKIYGVYIMKVGDLFKVGISSNVEKRRKALKGDLLNFTEIGDFKAAWMYEHWVHYKLQAYCVSNEYFDCDYPTVIRAYNDSLFNLTTIPSNHTMYVDLKPLTPPESDGSLEGIIKRFKYLSAN